MNELKVRLPLDVTFDRPIVQLRQMKGMFAMIDTGALCPIWVQDERELLSSYNVRCEKEDVTFTVFGGIVVHGSLYTIDVFTLDNSLFYTNMPIIASRDESFRDVSMLFPMTMFRGMQVALDPQAGVLELTILDGQPSRRIKITDEGGEIHILSVH